MYGKNNDGQIRLDAGESMAFLRQLEDIDQKVYARRYPNLLARQVVQVKAIPWWAPLHTYRETDIVANPTKVITDHGDDFPSVEPTSKETPVYIKDYGNSYNYTVKEAKQAVMTGMLDIIEERAMGSRTSFEQKIDDVLAYGDPSVGINGVLKLDATTIPVANRVGTYTLATKQAGGVAWGTIANPKATGQEMANDVIGACAARVSATLGIWTEFDVFIPIDQYNLMVSTRLNPLTDKTAYDFAVGSKFVRSITPWYKCAGAGAAGADRMLVLPAGDSEVVQGLVPQEWSPQAPQLRNMKYVINAMGSCGGVFARRPVAMQYADGL